MADLGQRHAGLFAHYKYITIWRCRAIGASAAAIDQIRHGDAEVVGRDLHDHLRAELGLRRHQVGERILDQSGVQGALEKLSMSQHLGQSAFQVADVLVRALGDQRQHIVGYVPSQRG